mgnify:CR=1 FL=1
MNLLTYVELVNVFFFLVVGCSSLLEEDTDENGRFHHPRYNHMRINQGNIYWIQSEEPDKSELGHYSHPYVVIQDNLFNRSRIHTVIICAITSNIKRANAPGNVLLDIGEANLPKQSVVEVSKVSSVKKTELGEYIGHLSEQRIEQILAGMRFLQASSFTR